MGIIDIRSIMLVLICNGIFLSFLTLWLWRHNKKRYPETQWWFIAVTFITTGVVLISLSDILPPVISFLLGDMLVLAGFFLLYYGLALFLKSKVVIIPNIIILTAVFFAFINFILITPDMQIRIFIYSAATILIILQCCYAIVRKGNKFRLKNNKVLLLIFISILLNHIFRVIANSIYPPGNNFLESGNFNAIFLTICLIQLTLLVIVFFQLINIRLQFKLSKSLEQREILIREIHHRVKNNLSIIESLLSLQALNTKDENAKLKLKASESRVKSMSMIHEILYLTNDLKSINLKTYIADLSEFLLITYTTNPHISLKLNIAEIHFDIDTMIPLGLIINELITNALKYAFQEDKSGNIIISLDLKKDNHYLLMVKDDGKGLPETFTLKNNNGIGMDIISSLTKQLGGTLQYQSKGGTEFRIRFPKPAY